MSNGEAGMPEGLCHGGPLDGQIALSKNDCLKVPWPGDREFKIVDTKEGLNVAMNEALKVHTYSKVWMRNGSWYLWYEWR